MKSHNVLRLCNVRDRMEDTVDGDLVNGEYRTTVYVSQQDMQVILEVIADEVGLTVGNPPSDEEYDAVYEAMRDDDLYELWDVIDGWLPGTRNSSHLDGMQDLIRREQKANATRLSGYTYTDKKVLEEVKNG